MKNKQRTKKVTVKRRNGLSSLAKLAKSMSIGAKMAPRKARTTMGPVSAVSTAPVAIGNSIRGSKSVVRQIPNGVRVVGRDFMLSPTATTSAVTNWCMIGGAPLSPSAFGDTNLRQYVQMYQKYRWKRIVVHYITASATNAAGDIMIYRQKNRNSVFVNQTSSFLLPLVISDPQTVLGPQWTNHSAVMEVSGTWKSTDYGMNSDINDYADGDVFLLSKTTSTNVPGYLLFDYEIEFKEQQISPRLLSIPLPRSQWFNTSLGGTSVSWLADGACVLAEFGNNLAGVASSAPTNVAVGDVYKMILDVTNSTALPTGIQTLFIQPTGTAVNTSLPTQDGTTIYAVWLGSSFMLYPNAETAFTETNNLRFGATNTNVSFTLQVWISLIGQLGSLNNNPNY